MSQKLITQNKKAYHEYTILETWETGIVLLGSEVKSCRRGSANLKDSYGRIENNEIFLVDAHIGPYSFANRLNHDPLRKRKLLLHKREIKKLYGKIRQKGQTFIPLKMYFNDQGNVKVEMALAQGKTLHDRREDIRKKDMRRDLERDLKGRP
ncbi:MAG: SsrA-binding protein SmpB [Proteobacteria bacterium]|jgi:SsrA-binding protein|nr:SsrA-binding protein SmpB [Pseudomonadota bacterium]